MSQQALGATWRTLAVRIFAFCFALASTTQGSLAVAPEGDRLQPDPASKITSPELGAALLIGGKDRKLTAERPGGFDRTAMTGRQNLLRPQKRFAFRAGRDRLIQGTALLLRVVAVRGPPRRSCALDSRLGRFVDGESLG
jgi:hypothetical protein